MMKILTAFLFISSLCNSQIDVIGASQHFDEFFTDAVYFSDKFITPATDAAAYQASSGWIYTAKKNKFLSTSLGIHSNVFFVPNVDRSFVLSNSDFTFLKLMNGESDTVQSALGDDKFVRITDKYGIISVMQPIKTPKGVDSNTIFYPHLSMSVALWCGIELLGKYAPKTTIKQGEYEVYGFGIKHNLSQYLPNLELKKINISMALSRSIENISFDFLEIQTNIGSLGINRITGNVKTWQLQTNISKEIGNFEIMLGSMVNMSDFKYNFVGEKGTSALIINGLGTQDYFNKRLQGIFKSKINAIFEISATYNFRKFYFQSAFAFNKFLNSNLSVNYKFN